MSMLSNQIERLWDMAKELRMLAPGLNAPFIVPSTKETMALSMQSAASEMEQAADTIERLRERLQDEVLRGECEFVPDDEFSIGAVKCSVCGEHWFPENDKSRFRFSPCCGKAVKR